HKNIIKYWEDIYALVRDMGDFLYIYDKVPFSHAGVKTFDYRELMNNNGFFDKNKIKACRDYPLSFLKTSVQDNLLDKANELLQKEYFKFNIDLNIKLRIISTIFNLDKEIIMLLQRFDYPFMVPKIIIYNSTERSFSVEDYITIALLNAMGMDIIILSPTGYNNIENGIKNSLFDIHNLEDVRFDLVISKEISREIKRRKSNQETSLLDKFKSWIK
ncbi:MAG: YceG family protein, partial [Bacillota bacterium]|nr:YceG family protein [Bacillota bacterium]